jgi:hypothetical protein
MCAGGETADLKVRRYVWARETADLKVRSDVRGATEEPAGALLLLPPIRADP